MQKFLKVFLFVSVYLVLPGTLCGQSDSYPRFSHISTKDGLPDNDIYSIFQDKTGFLWFGSYSALTRYDGYNFKVFVHDHDNPNSPPKGVIVAMTEDIYGNCWIASDVGGLLKFDLMNHKFTPCKYLPDPEKPSVNNGISWILSDDIGSLWITTRNGNVQKIDIKSWKSEVFSFNCFKDQEIQSERIPICRNNNGDIWVGLKKYNAAKNRFELPDLSADEKQLLLNSYISCMATDDSSNIWLGTRTGILKYTTATCRLQKIVNWGESTDVLNITIDSKNNAVWMNSNTAGLSRLDQKSGRISYYKPDPRNKFDHVVHSILFDRQRNLWVANGDGLHKLASIALNFKQYEVDPDGKRGITRPIIRAMYLENDNVLWVGGRGGGLNRITLKPEQHYEHYLLEPVSNEYGNNFINHISCFRKDEIFVGTNTGLYIFNTKTRKVSRHIVLHEPGRPFEISIPFTVWSVLEDTGQNLWIGTQGAGLFLYNLKSGSIKPFKTGPFGNNSYCHSVWYIFKDSHMNIWGGTDTGMFTICRNSQGDISFKQYAEESGKWNSYQGQDSWQLYEDANGILWIASIGGLNRFDPNTGVFRCFTVKDGLPSNNISGILEPNNHTLLISTLKGLCIFDKDLNKVLNTYYESDGLQSDHLGFRTCLQSSSGEIFLGGQSGINSFFLKDIKTMQDTSPVVITSFKKYYKDFTAELLKNSTITLNYDENSISFDFAVLDYTNTAKNQFRYYLEGADKAWSQPGYNHFAGYNYLPPGEYVFHLMGKNSANIWSKPVAFTVIIKPALWNTMWFRFASYSFLAAFGGVFLHSLVKQQREKRKRLESDLTALRAQLNPHFIFNSLSSLHYFITTHKEILALEYVSNFAMLIRMILSNSQSSFVFLADEIKFLKLYIYMESVRFDNMISFDIKIDPTVNEETMKVPPMLIQPLIENSMKHGLLGTRQNGKIIISFIADDYYIYCIVEDNGVGLAKAEENKKERFIDFPSFSTNSINERLQKIRDKAGRRGSLTLQNIEADGLITGTRAVLKIPRRIKTTLN